MDKTVSFRLKADQLKPLLAKSNAQGALHALGHFGAIAIAAYATWVSRGTLWTIACTLILGYLLAFLFTAEHECAHHTAFKTRFLNQVVGHVSGFTLLLPFEYYRAYHWDHHRYTQDPLRDPELVTMPLPKSFGGLLLRYSNLRIWFDRILLLCRHAFAGEVVVPWVTPESRPMIAREARFYLSAYVLTIVLSFAFHTDVVVRLLFFPAVIGQFFLRPYLLAEHTGCEDNDVHLENTRTTYSNGVIRFFAWNMPYHSEHHTYPSVPFHALPALNALLSTHILHSARGYPDASRQVLAHLFPPK
jgi:fatty acid desaturase